MAEKNFKLSSGAVATLMTGGEVEKPVFQILGFKKIGGQAGADRFRLNISDGLHTHTFAMLATQLNTMISSGELDNFCIIRADKLVSNSVSPEKRVLIILELSIIAKGSSVGERIGNPVQFNEKGQGPKETPIKTEPSKTASAFYGSKPVSAPPQSPAGGNSSFGGVSDSNVVPIRDLNPYNNKCTIKARITTKTDIRTYSNARGDGKRFSFDLLDETGEIKMTAFNAAVDQFYEMLKLNEVYLISKFSVKPANKNFSTLNHDYELFLNTDSQVMPCLDTDAENIPTMTFNFMEIAYIETCEKDKLIDVIGVCKNRAELSTIVTKRDNRELTKREISLIDRTNTTITLTLWGKQAEEFEDDSNPVIAVKGAKVGDFQGRNLSLVSSSTMLINPDIPEAHVLRGWYDNEGINVEAKSLGGQRGPGGAAGGNAPWKYIREANDADVSSVEAGYYFRSKVMVMAIKRDNAMYKACPEERCNKKVIDSGNGIYRCEKCNKDHHDFKWRVIVNASFADCSDSVWATCFQEQGELMLGSKADELGSLFEGEQDAFDAVIKQAVFKSYNAKFRGKLETYNNESRIKYSIVDLQPLNYADCAKELVNQIRETMA